MAAPAFFEERSIAVERSCRDEEGRTLAQAVVNSIREPLIVLDKNVRAVTANRSFYLTFMMSRQEVQGQPIHVLGDGQWDIPELRSLLRETATQRAAASMIGDRRPIVLETQVEGGTASSSRAVSIDLIVSSTRSSTPSRVSTAAVV